MRVQLLPRWFNIPGGQRTETDGGGSGGGAGGKFSNVHVSPFTTYNVSWLLQQQAKYRLNTILQLNLIPQQLSGRRWFLLAGPPARWLSISQCLYPC